MPFYKERSGQPGGYVTLPRLLPVPRTSPAPHKGSQFQPRHTELQCGLKASMQKILASSGYWGPLSIPTRAVLQQQANNKRQQCRAPHGHGHLLLPASSEGHHQNLWGPTAKAGVSSLSLVTRLFFSEWLDSRMWSWPLNFLAFVSDRCHIGDVICPAVLIATRRFCCSSWRLIRKNCLQSLMWLLRVHPCPVLCLCLRQCSLFPSHRRREHKGCSWREGHFAPLQFRYA